ncbi:MAG: OprO/OprP family phosphate-selective porin [Candidatus Omnitrophica bacterium]|nr:OprO/OprP family phosphate-selective porin [Candidatus Omnitrophota bacterium]
MKKNNRRLAIVGIVLFLAHNVYAADDIQARVSSLEKKLESPLVKKVMDANLNAGGYLQAYYGWFEENSDTDSFEIRRLFVALSGELDEDIAFKAQVDAAASTDILRDGWVQYKGVPGVSIKFGQFKIPFSQEQLTSASKLDTIIRSRVVTALSYGRDIGIMLEAEAMDKAVSYEAAIVNGSGRNASDTNENKDIIARVVVVPFKDNNNSLKDLRAGLSFQRGRQALSGTDEGHRERYGALLAYANDKFKINSEYLYQDLEQIDRSSIYSDGWYITGTYKISDIFQGVVKFERYDLNRKIGADEEDVITLGVNIFAVKDVLIQANYRIKTEQVRVDNDEFLLQAQVEF